MVVPHTANVGVSPQREDLPNDGHPPQGAVNQLHDVGVAHLLKMESTSTLHHKLANFPRDGIKKKIG